MTRLSSVWACGVCLGALLMASGCMTVYQNTVTPYTRDFKNAPVGSKKCVVPSFRVRVPAVGYNVAAEFDVNTVVRAAREAGMHKIYYADEEVLVILLVFRRKALIVYGD